MYFLNKYLYKNTTLLTILFVLICFLSVAAQDTFIVSNTNDSGVGSLRQAITDASGWFPPDTVRFQGINYPDTIRLTSGSISISNLNVIIIGPGADSLSISAEHLSQIFTFGEGGADVIGLSLNNGYNYGFGSGGAFDIGGADYLNLFDCIVSGNRAIGDSTQPSSSGFGGAFFNSGGQISLVRTAVFNNGAKGGAGSDGYGGAIYQLNGNCYIENSTISNNIVAGGPEIAAATSGIGGGIFSSGGTLTIISSTIAENRTITGIGGGIYIFGGTVDSITNTIIGINVSDASPDVFGNFNSVGYNLISNTSGSTGWHPTDLVDIIPHIAILRNNGGATLTHGLLPNSPALDAGFVAQTDSVDQRGFPRIQDGNGDDIAIIDIGAYEAVVPDKPINLQTIHGDKIVDLSWQYANDSGIIQYNIYRDSLIVGNVPTGTINFTDINLTNGQAYIYNITAVDTIGFESSFSLPATATPNGPPRWSIPAGLLVFDEDDSLLVDLDEYLFDDSDEDSLLTIGVTPGNFVMINIDPDSHIAKFTAPLNVFGWDTVIFNASDPEGLTAFDTAVVRVRSVNDLPVITPIPDTTILTYADFNYQVIVNDLEGDSIRYLDNTPLFDIDSTGLIEFRPTKSDTGLHSIIIFARDNIAVVRDTFNLTIQLSTINAPTALTVNPLDQALNFTWTHPQNQLPSRTAIVMRKNAPPVYPDSGFIALDTIFASPGTVSYTTSNLDIAENYYFIILNYYIEDSDILLSEFVSGSDSTLSPLVSVDLSARNFSVVNNTVFDTSIVLTNNGGGTLTAKFTYNQTPIWFLLDTTLQTVPPFSSVLVPMRISIPAFLTDSLLSISVNLQTNQPGWQEQSIGINVLNIFDRFAPQVFIESQPDSLVREAAVRFKFSANDTANSQIGDYPEQLLARYALYNILTRQFVRNEDSLQTNEIIIYPLVDGVYEFGLWVYDRSENGTRLNEVAFVDTFAVYASRKVFPRRKWLLSSIPRDENYSFPAAVGDSDFVIFRWNSNGEEYDQITSRSVKPGLGYWIYSNEVSTLNVNNIPFEVNNDSVVVPIVVGWNQVGIPMPFNVEMNKVLFARGNASLTSAVSLPQAISDSSLAPAIYWYESTLNQSGYEWGFLDTTFATPWTGYWIYSNVNGNLIYPKTPSFRNSSSALNKPKNILADSWEINLSFETEDMADSKNIIGTRNGTKYQILEPPVLDKYVSLYFKPGKNKLAGLYDSPLKDQSEVKQFEIFYQTTETNKPHSIKWRLPDNNVYFYLVDNQSEQIINLREQPEYFISPNSKSGRFDLYATYNAEFKPSIIPAEFKLKQNYPNPFNPITTIEFGIPENGKDNITTLKIYNILGQEIITLVNKKLNSGYHKITWNGVNGKSQKVASGLYFYSLSNGKTELFKKMIFMK